MGLAVAAVADPEIGPPVACAPARGIQLVTADPADPVPLDPADPVPLAAGAALTKGLTLLPPLALAYCHEKASLSLCRLIGADWSFVFRALPDR